MSCFFWHKQTEDSGLSRLEAPSARLEGNGSLKTCDRERVLNADPNEGVVWLHL